MPMFKRCPEIDSCCGCIPDLRTASAIIAVLGIVSSPVVSWSLIRHSYVIRVACFVSTASQQVDVVDVNLNNVVSFGFGINAGLGPSCLKKNMTANTLHSRSEDPGNVKFIEVVKGFGWAVMAVDCICVLSSMYFLAGIYTRPSRRAATVFMFTSFFAVVLSSINGILYVICCLSLGGALPLFELFFALFDIALWSYFLMVVNSYRLYIQPPPGHIQP